MLQTPNVIIKYSYVDYSLCLLCEWQVPYHILLSSTVAWYSGMGHWRLVGGVDEQGVIVCGDGGGGVAVDGMGVDKVK